MALGYSGSITRISGTDLHNIKYMHAVGNAIAYDIEVFKVSLTDNMLSFDTGELGHLVSNALAYSEVMTELSEALNICKKNNINIIATCIKEFGVTSISPLYVIGFCAIRVPEDIKDQLESIYITNKLQDTLTRVVSGV